MQVKNAKDWPSLYSCKFLEAGIVSYKDSDSGIALLKKETIDRMAPSFIGKPVIIDHQSVDASNFEKAAVGYVTRVYFNPDDAWFWADFIVTKDEAKKCIDEKGYSVSCAFNVLDVTEGGLWHDIEFDGEITEGSFTHLALVENPRYEESQITKQLPSILVNGKLAFQKHENKEEKQMFKIFKEKENDKQEDFTNLHVSLNGKDVPVEELITFYAENSKKEEKKVELVMAKDEDIVDINGNKVSIADLKAFYSQNAKKNDVEEEVVEDKKKNEKDEEEKEKENEKEEEKEKEEKKDKKNEKEEEKEKQKENSKQKGAEYFTSLNNAGRQVDSDEVATPVPLTRAQRAEKWKARNQKVSA